MDSPIATRPASALVLLKGHPATGKSTLAQALARRGAWPLIDKDDIKDFTAELPSGNRLAYDIMWRLVETELRLGLSVVVDSPLSYPAGYATGQALACRYAARLLVVETTVTPGEWQQRLEERRRGPAGHKIGSWSAMQELLRAYDGCWRYPIDARHHLRIDTREPVDTCVAQVLRRLQDGEDAPVS